MECQSDSPIPTVARQLAGARGSLGRPGVAGAADGLAAAASSTGGGLPKCAQAWFQVSVFTSIRVSVTLEWLQVLGRGGLQEPFEGVECDR